MKPPPITVTSDPGRSFDGARAEGPCIREGAQQQGQIAALDVQLTWPCAGRDQALLERDRGPVVEGGTASVKIERRDATSRDELDAPALVPTLGLGEDELVRQIVAEQLLAQRRAVVGQERLIPDERDSSGEALPTKRPRASDRGDPAADEQDLDRRARLSHDGILVVTLR